MRELTNPEKGVERKKRVKLMEGIGGGRENTKEYEKLKRETVMHVEGRGMYKRGR